MATNSEFVSGLLQNLFGSTYAAANQDAYISALDLGTKTQAEVGAEVLASAAGQQAAQVARLYDAYFNRIPDAAGLSYWVDLAVNQGWSVADIGTLMSNQPEYTATYNGLTSEQIVDAIYQNTLGRAADAEGKAYWVSLLDAGTPVGAISSAVTLSGEYVTTTEGTINTILVYQGALGRAATAEEVTAGASQEVGALFTTLVPPDAPVGETFTLTTGADADVLVGTDGSDTFDATTEDSFSAGDLVIDSSTTDADVMDIVISTMPTNTKIQNVESVNVTAAADSTVTFNAANVTNGKVTLNNEAAPNAWSSAGAISVTDVDGSKGVSIAAGTGVTTLAASNIQKNASVYTGSATTLTLDGVATAADSTATIVLEGAGAALAANLAALGQGFSAVTLDNTVAAKTVTVGDGVLTTDGTVTLTGDQNVTVAGTAAAFDGRTVTDSSTGTSTLRIAGTGGSAVLNDIATDSIDIAAADAATYTVANNANVTLSTDAGALTIDRGETTAVTGDVLNLSLAADQTTETVTVGEFETVNLNTSALAADDVDGVATVTNLTGAATTVVNVAGANDLVLTAATAQEVNAAALTGALTATVSANLLKVTGGSGADTINAAAEDFTVDGGAGGDVLVVGAVDLSSNTIAISNVEAIELTGAATFAASQLSGETYTAFGNDFSVVQMDGTSLDLSGITGDETTTVSISLDAGVAGASQTIVGAAGLMNNIDVSNLTGIAKATVTGGDYADTVTGSNNADTINGGGDADILTGGTGADVLTGGAGDDIFVFATGTGALDSGDAAATADVIMDFAAADDTVRLDATDAVAGASGTAGTAAATDVEVSAGGKVTFHADDNTLAEKLVAVAADGTDIADGEVVFFEDSGNTYIYGAGDLTANAADDFLITLTGVTGLTTLSEAVAGDFTFA